MTEEIKHDAFEAALVANADEIAAPVEEVVLPVESTEPELALASDEDGDVESDENDPNAEFRRTLATAAGDWKQKIGTQKWIALYNRPYEGWVEIRRLDQPKIAAPVNAKLTSFPTRFSYPSTEQTLNGANYTAAASAVGGDLYTTKLFWDKN